MPRPSKGVRNLFSILEGPDNIFALSDWSKIIRVEQWLVKHEGDSDLLKRSANYRGKDSCTVLWHLVHLFPEVAIIERIL
jgi:hypothetical protein